MNAWLLPLQQEISSVRREKETLRKENEMLRQRRLQLLKQRSQLLQQKNKNNEPTNIEIRDSSSPEFLYRDFDIKVEYDTKFDVSDTSASIVLRTADINGMEVTVYGSAGSLPTKIQKAGRRLTVKRSRSAGGKYKNSQRVSQS
jgi:hypothetical protein